jgi:hypothetical protein
VLKYPDYEIEEGSVVKAKRTFFKVAANNGVSVTPELLRLQFGGKLEAYDLNILDLPVAMLRDYESGQSTISNLTLIGASPEEVIKVYPLLQSQLRRGQAGEIVSVV